MGTLYRPLSLNSSLMLSTEGWSRRQYGHLRTSAGLEVHVVGFSPSRELTEADLNFTAAPGATLQTTTVTENLASVATTWFKSAGSTQYGSQLMLVLPFTASQGSVDAVGSVSVVLKNAKGSSPSASGTF